MSDNNIQHIKDAFAQLKYHIIGYNHSDAQRNDLEPWFYPKNKGDALPSEVGVYLNQLQTKYAIASMRKWKQLGSWMADVFIGIVADGMSVDAIAQVFQPISDEWMQIFKKKFFPKGTVKLFDARTNYALYVTFGLIFNNGIDDSHLKNVRKLSKKIKNSKFNRPYIIDMVNKRVLKHGGLPNTLSPKPKKIEPLLF